MDLWASELGLAFEGCVEEGIDCVVEIARRGGVDEREVDLERVWCPHGADRVVEDGFMPLAVLDLACKS